LSHQRDEEKTKPPNSHYGSADFTAISFPVEHRSDSIDGYVVACRSWHCSCDAGLAESGVYKVIAARYRTENAELVAGKAFYDIAHAPADHSNRRHSPKDYAVWEIHPVMKMEVIQ
jgi:hypothetical protein